MRGRVVQSAVALGFGVALLSSRALAQESPPVAPPMDPQPQQNLGPLHDGTYQDPAAQPGTVVETAPPATSSATKTTSAEYNEQASAETYRETTFRPNRPLLITGAAMFGAAYGTSVIGAAASDLEADKRNYIPLVGPWLDLGQRPCAFGSDCTTGDNVTSAFLIAGGAVQAAGVILALTSLAVPEKKVERVTAEVHVLPLTLAGGAGVGAIGQF